jgi:hypothetical protein
MGRRCRHFPWKAVGASAALDARRITGLSNGAAVATWADVSGNARDFSNSISGERPTYESAGINGQPTVLNAAGKGLCFPTALPVGGSGEESQFHIFRFNTTGFGYQVVFSNGHTGGNSMAVLASATGDSLTVYNVGSESNGSAITTTSMVASATGGPSGRSLWRNGVSETVTNPTTPNATTRAVGTVDLAIFNGQDYGAGVGCDKYNSVFRGSIGIASSLPYIVTAPIRKRIEHSLAFSYKLPCS